MCDNEQKVLDLRGLKCPLPVLKATKFFKALDVGQEVRLETTDPMAIIDIPAFCNENGHSLLSSKEDEGYHVFLVKKGEGSS